MFKQLESLGSKFHYQFYRGQNQSNQTVSEKDVSDKSLRRWIFLHGLMGFARNWQKIATSLTENDLSFVYDQRGHGKSFQPVEGYGPEDYALDLEIIRQALGWDKFHLVGHSMGGRNAFVYAADHPQHVEKLVIEDMGPEGSTNAEAYYQKLFQAIPAPFSSRSEARNFFTHIFPTLDLSGSHGSMLGAFLYTNMREHGNGQTDWSFRPEAMIESVRAGRAVDHWEQIKNLKVPTLLIRGENSTELSRATFHKVLEMNSLIQGYEIPNAGHWVHSDQPSEFTRCLLNFAAGAAAGFAPPENTRP